MTESQDRGRAPGALCMSHGKWNGNVTCKIPQDRGQVSVVMRVLKWGRMFYLRVL